MRVRLLTFMMLSGCFDPSPTALETDTSATGGTTAMSSSTASADSSTSENPTSTSTTSATATATATATTTDTSGADTSSEGGVESSSSGDSSSGGPVEEILFDFYEERCTASWLAAPDTNSGAELIPCDGADSFMGSVRGLAAAVIDGGDAAELVLRVVPWNAVDGNIGGNFAGISLIGAKAPVFRTRIACPAEAPDCGLEWQVLVWPAGAAGFPDIIEEGSEVGDGTPTDLEVDLSMFANGAVDVALIVGNDGTTSPDDISLWVHPRIVES